LGLVVVALAGLIVVLVYTMVVAVVVALLAIEMLIQLPPAILTQSLLVLVAPALGKMVLEQLEVQAILFVRLLYEVAEVLAET
jgi:hypothetical protein